MVFEHFDYILWNTNTDSQRLSDFQECILKLFLYINYHSLVVNFQANSVLPLFSIKMPHYKL